jgi:hypothetical protein
MAYRREWVFGTHRAHFEEPDILYVDFDGPTTVEDGKSLLSILQEAASQGPVFVVAEIEGSSIDKATRELFSQQARPEWVRGLIYVGVGPLLRAGAKAVAFGLYFTGKWKGDVEFVDSAQAARELIERKRATLQRSH